MVNAPKVGDLQRLFFHLVIRWANWAEARGYSFTWGEAFRSDEQAEINVAGILGRERMAILLEKEFPQMAAAIRNNGKANGIRLTAHGQRLALDLNAFKAGELLTRTEEWRELGEYWEDLHESCRWGGHFGDGNHLSMEFNGVK